MDQVDDKIQFTHEIQDQSITFLDVKIIRTSTGLATDLYRKTTDQNNILLYQSFHQDSLKNICLTPNC